MKPEPVNVDASESLELRVEALERKVAILEEYSHSQSRLITDLLERVRELTNTRRRDLARV